MADNENETPIDEEELLKNHRKEKKDLNAKIQKLKHSTPKGDKKKKKDILTEITKLESDLNEKHAKELKELTGTEFINSSESMLNGDPPDLEPITTEKPRASKTQRRRDKKVSKERERDELIANAEIENVNGVRNIESRKLKTILKKRNLSVFEIPSDGNCMYKALEHQLSLTDVLFEMEDLRTETANFMREHPDDFMPFITNPKTGDQLTKDEFEKFCKDTATSTVWGGQIELRALSHILKNPIEVVQAEGPTITIGEEYHPKPPLILSYHRHAFRSGEHYNSVISFVPEETEEPAVES